MNLVKNPQSIKLSIIGMTEENGHPFPGITAYLNKEDPQTMRLVRKCSWVEHVVDAPETMIGQVDAVIIATDIGSEHITFVEAGIPLFIDKPLCDNRDDLAIFRRWIDVKKMSDPALRLHALRQGTAAVSPANSRVRSAAFHCHADDQEMGNLRHSRAGSDLSHRRSRRKGGITIIRDPVWNPDVPPNDRDKNEQLQ